ncbi:hypothetical protein [Amycolatopsis jejuensis]|uniref:hypothetical protein n=1 Tax=Amycolatopsis jejuensis TaxID=330084 RepID=UPI0007C4ADD2|nr:hypothetical protein [Amycolatopsis jejuensis]
MRAARLTAIVLIGLGVVGYSAWLLEFFIPTEVSPLDQPASDLLHAQPVFRIVTSLAGLAFLLAGPPLMRLAPVHWTGRLTAVAVSTFGIVLIVHAGVPETVVTPVLLNVIFVIGAGSLVLWWPPGWRAWAVGGLVTVLVAWVLVLVSSMVGHLDGLFSRVQLAVHALEFALGGAYVVQMPLTSSGGRKLSVPGEMLRSNIDPK